MIDMKQLRLEEIQSNKELINQYESEIKMLENGTSIAAGMSKVERRRAIDELRVHIQSLKESITKLEKELEEDF